MVNGFRHPANAYSLVQIEARSIYSVQLDYTESAAFIRICLEPRRKAPFVPNPQTSLSICTGGPVFNKGLHDQLHAAAVTLSAIPCCVIFSRSSIKALRGSECRQRCCIHRRSKALSWHERFVSHYLPLEMAYKPIVTVSITRKRLNILYSVSQKIPPGVFCHFFPNGWEYLVQILHIYSTFLSTLDYNFLSNDLQL